MPKTFTSDEFVAAVKAGAHRSNSSATQSLLGPIVMFVGPDQERIRRTMTWFTEQLFPNRAPQISRYHGNDLSAKPSAESFSLSICTTDLFTTQKCLILTSVEQVRVAHRDMILKALNAPTPGTWVLATAPEINKKPGFFADFLKIAHVVTMSELTGDKLLRWMGGELERLSPGTKLDRNAAETLMQAHGSDTRSMSQDLERLALIVAPSARISKALVDEHVNVSVQRQSFELFTLVARGQTLAASACALDLLRNGQHGLQLSSFLSRCFRTAAVALGITEKNRQKSEFPPQFQISAELTNAWFVKQITPGLRNLNGARIADCIGQLLKFDLQAKSSRREPEDLLLECIERLCSPIATR